MVLLPVLGIFSVRTDVDACDCTRGLLIVITILVLTLGEKALVFKTPKLCHVVRQIMSQTFLVE